MRKVVVMGFPGVGKTTIGVQFVDKKYVDSYSPTISNTFHTTLSHNGTSYDLEIVDSAGQDEHSMWHAQHAIGVDGFIMVYSVVNKKSFGVIRVVNDKILDACGTEKVARVLVGNKSDLGKREVTREEGQVSRVFGFLPCGVLFLRMLLTVPFFYQDLAKEIGCAFVECSAKKNENIETAFRLLLDEMDKINAPPRGVKPTKPAGEDSGCMVL